MASSPELPTVPYTLDQRRYAALLMDLGSEGDITSKATIEAEQLAHTEFVVKADNGIISGLSVGREIFKLIDPHIVFANQINDGDHVKKGDVIAAVDGLGLNIVPNVRVALEFMRRMSGIATQTRQFVDAVAGTGTVILDTRKVMPLWGDLDKQAVLHGGGVNHRKDQSEMFLIKNYHIALLGEDIGEAIQKCRTYNPKKLLEVEVQNEKEFIIALANLPDRILLDNMTTALIMRAVAIRNQFYERSDIHIPLEASGNMTLERVREVALTGVEFISVGSLTHSVKAFDISALITFKK